MDILYKNIHDLRIAYGLSQEELAQKVGYKSRTSIAKIESGKVDLSKTKIQEFANVFGVLPKTLLYGDKKELENHLKIKRLCDGHTGLLSILTDIYGNARMEDVFNGQSTSFYFPLNEEFALSECNFDKLYDIIKFVIKEFTDLMKEDKNTLYQDCLEISKFTNDIPDTAEEFEKMYPPVEIDTDKKKNIG